MKPRADRVDVIRFEECETEYQVKRIELRLVIPKLNEPEWNGELMVPLAEPIKTGAGEINYLHLEAAGRKVTVWHLADGYKTSQLTRKAFIQKLRKSMGVVK